MATFTQYLLARTNRWHSVRSYNALVARYRRQYRGDYNMAMIASIGDLSPAEYDRQGDAHVAVLRHNGLRDGMAVYDLGCGSGRTATALRRAGWHGKYTGADIIRPLVRYLKKQCPSFEAIVHRKNSIAAADESLDIVFHWSVFTHLYPEECYLYMEDSYRALKPGGRLVFSFLELEDIRHHGIFRSRLGWVRKRGWADTLDTFLHRDWLRFWAADIGFEAPSFTDGTDGTHHPAFWQSIAAMTKPAD